MEIKDGDNLNIYKQSLAYIETTLTELGYEIKFESQYIKLIEIISINYGLLIYNTIFRIVNIVKLLYLFFNI